MGTQDLHSLFQQMGEVLSGLKALREAAEMRHAQSEQLQDLMRADVATIRNDQRELEEKLECVICVMQHDLEALRTGAAATARSICDLLSAVESLRRPIADISALRSRAAGLFLGVGVVGSVMLWVADPIYKWFVEHLLSGR